MAGNRPMMKLWKFLKEWDEVWTIPVAVLMLILSPHLFRLYDPTAGSYDVGILQKMFLVFIFLLIGNAFSYIMMRLNNKRQYDRLDELNNELTQWQHVKLAYFRFYFYLAAFVAMVALMK